MTIREASEILKDTVSAQEAARLWGYNPGRNGTIICPFHGDRDASLHLWPGRRGWCCFGCHAGGSVIDLVMHLEGVNFAEAVRILDDRAGTGLLDKVETGTSRKAVRAARLDSVKKDFVAAWESVRAMAEQEAARQTRALLLLEDIPRENRTGAVWDRINTTLERLEELEDLIRDAIRHREEVYQWRTTSARAARATTPSSPAQPSTPSPASRMRDRLRQAQNQLMSRG